MNIACAQVRNCYCFSSTPSVFNLSPIFSSTGQPGHTAPCWPPATRACPSEQEKHCGGMADERGQHTTEIQTGETYLHLLISFMCVCVCVSMCKLHSIKIKLTRPHCGMRSYHCSASAVARLHPSLNWALVLILNCTENLGQLIKSLHRQTYKHLAKRLKPTLW